MDDLSAGAMFLLWFVMILAAHFGHVLIERIERSIDEWLR